jgi:hypothetical protein
LALHGDFSTFDSNFVGDGSGLAVYLAKRGLDVWGVDRRWTLVPAGTSDVSGLRAQGFAAAVADTELALAVARALRALGDDDPAPLTLLGFSRGAQLTYAVALQEATTPPLFRQVRALVILDVYYRLAPEDEPLRLAACERYRQGVAQLDGGTFAADHALFGALGQLALGDPAAPSPALPGLTNAQALEYVAGQTFHFGGPTPLYHLNAIALVEGLPSAFVYSPFARVANWFRAAPPLQAQAELTDGDAVVCATVPQPIAGDLPSITTPLLYIGAAGGFGDAGLFSARLVGTSDVTTHVVRRLGRGDEASDFGHADLLLSPDAPALAWGTVADWIRHH